MPVGLRKSQLRRTLSRCVCPQKNERQQKKPNTWYNKQEKKRNRKFRILKFNTKI